MREDGKLLQVRVVFFQFEMRADDRIPPARIDHIVCAQFAGRAVLARHLQGDAILEEGDAFHGCFLADLGAILRRVIE